MAPQAVLLLRLIFDDGAALDVNARDFFVHDTASPVPGSRAQTTATLGVFYSFIGREGFSAVVWR